MRYSPWGAIDFRSEPIPGVVLVSTARHGGFWLSPERRTKMPNQHKIWYEEDCEAALVVLRFADEFDAKAVKSAHNMAKNFYPELYEEITGRKVPVEESLVLQRRAFDVEHINDWVVYSAIGRDDGMVLCHAKRGANERKFLVPKSEYTFSHAGGFVIDPQRHAEVR